jgi:hypothetical protein
MDERALRNRERRVLHDLVVANGYNSNEYEWTTTHHPGSGGFGARIEALEHRRSGSFFAIGVASDGTYYYGSFDPGQEAQVDRFGGRKWAEVTDLFVDWLGAIDPDEEADPWEEVAYTREELVDALGAQTANTALSSSEQTQVEEFVAAVRVTVTSARELSPPELERLDERLAEIEDAARRLTRKDFYNYAIGAVLTIAIELSLRSPTLGELVKHAIVALGHLVSGIAELPPASP